MRLLQLGDDAQSFSLVQYLGCDIPPYAILSHTWGSSKDEITYQDLACGTGASKTGYGKLTFCAAQAAKDGLRHFWVDTCCINKESSAELSEAITSMFNWYHDSAVCYVYLTDVSVRSLGKVQHQPGQIWESAFRMSRWFTRGWTLQELIASPKVVFFSGEGEFLGDKTSLEQHIHDVTRIPRDAIHGKSLNDFHPEERISWIETRRTTREEDMAYSLQGILGVSMIQNYGEGREYAFQRLRVEVERVWKGKRTVLDALRFDQMEVRQITVQDAHVRTCTWLLKDPGYLRWSAKDRSSEDHSFLWIKGKPGAGKSTLMKFAHAQACKTKAHTAVLSFFFDARGKSLEKSVLGAYRALLFQLLDRFPPLHGALDCLNLSRSHIRDQIVWTVEALKNVFSEALLLMKHGSLVCFIDALDECEEELVRDMVRFFGQIGERALLAGIDIRICFSSRHYPHITIQNAINLVLEGQQGHNQDINTYLKSELFIGENDIAQSIREDIQRRAAGVFMWVVLVVRMLNKAYDSGRLYALRQKLQEIPNDLHDLFHSILTRDSHNETELVLCIQWVLFAERPLTPGELYAAILSEVQSDALLAWEESNLDHDTIKRFILDSSRGLAEITRTRNAELHQVQFIHESVRDFFLKENGLGKIWPSLHDNFLSKSHDRLKRCCAEYLTVTGSATSQFLSPGPTMWQVHKHLKMVARRFPFLQYAVENVLHHAETAEMGGISQEDFLQDFSRCQWARMNNHSKCLEEYTEDVSLPYILAERDMINLLQLRKPPHMGLQEEQEPYGCPLFAAAARGSQHAVRALLEGLVEYEPSHSATTVQAHIGEVFKRISPSFRYSSERGIISYAAELGIAPGVGYMLKHVANSAADVRDDKGRTPLWFASRAGHATTVRLLLETNIVDVNSEDYNGESPLYVAVIGGWVEVVRQLLGRGANINTEGGEHGYAIMAALAHDHLEIANILLQTSGIDVNVYAENGMTPLVRAISMGQIDIFTLLCDQGANINAQALSGWAPLTSAINASSHQITELLLAKGADVNVECLCSGSALQAAAICRNEALAKDLIDRGANVNMQGGNYGTALQAAIISGGKLLVRDLINLGADVNLRGGIYGTAVQAASYIGDLDAVQLLIDGGADVNIQGGHYGAPLQVAARFGYTAIVKLLIRHNADVNARTGLYGTALQAASIGGCEEVVRILIEQGAEVNAQCGRHGNALNAAFYYHGGSEGCIADLLRRYGAMQPGTRKRRRAEDDDEQRPRKRQRTEE